MEIKHPEVKVQLTGNDGNAFAVIGRCIEAARRKGVDKEEISLFQKEAMSSDYDNLLCTCMQWFDVS